MRIEAHKVYNEYIQDKQHVHMNSTKWLTLTEYVKYLGREGFCKVEETEKGWYISVIHRDLEQVCSPSSHLSIVVDVLIRKHARRNHHLHTRSCQSTLSPHDCQAPHCSLRILPCIHGF